jgi:hypothetical protein
MTFSHLSQRRRLVRRGLAVAAVAALGAGLLLAAPEGAQAGGPNNDKGIILAVGANGTQRMLSWYSATGDDQQVVYGPSSTFGAGTGTTTLSVTPVANTQGATSSFNARATLTNLAPNTAYSYKVGSEAGGWSTTFTFKTSAVDLGTGFSADFFGDPQIGASGQADIDGDGWVQTIKFAQSHDTDTELYLSGGDQIDDGSAADTVGPSGANKVEYQWDNFLRPFTRGVGPDNMTGDQVPWAPTIGNHDVSTKTYQQHLAQPNLSDDSRYYAAPNSMATTSGGNYWFTYRDVLFIDLNSNSYNPVGGTQTGDPAHVAYVQNVIAAHGASAKYTVLLYHHAIYSPADHANDGDNAIRRRDFTTAFSQLGVDLVLQGHDHSYSRSYAIKNGARTDTASELVGGQWAPESSDGAGNPDGTTILPGPGGVIYVTANSASGSKYYDLTAPSTANNGDYGPDPTETSAQVTANGAVVGGHRNHWPNAVESQEHVPSYIHVHFGPDKVSVTDVRSGDCATTSANAAVERGNVGFCGNTGNTWAGAVNDASGADTDGNGINGENITPATPTNATTNDAWNTAHPKGSLVDAFTIQQFVAPSAVTVSGTPTVGQTLSAALTGAFTTGTDVTYAWKADGVPFGTSTSVALTPEQAGKRISVTVRGTLGAYEPLSVDSVATAPVTSPAPPPPAMLSASTPTIDGKVKVGKTLQVDTGSWTPGTSYSVTWFANGKQVGTGSSLKLTKKMRGKKITVSVTGSLAGYASVTKTSAPTAKVKK